MAKKSSELSPRGRRLRTNESLTNKHADQLADLETMQDADINTADIPEKLDWSNAEIGKFYRPVKKLISLRVDADILDWFQARGAQYTPLINRALRIYIASQEALPAPLRRNKTATKKSVRKRASQK